MLKYIGKRILQMIPVMLGVIILIFSLMSFLPGNPAQMMLGSNASQEDVDAMMDQLGLNDPFLVRMFNYAKNIVTKFDFGDSYVSRRPVVIEIANRFPYTLRLAIFAALVSTVIGVLCGVVAATRQYSIFDGLATTVALLGISMPLFWFALMLILIFSINLNWLPVSGSYGAEYWILPVVAVGVTGAANIMRTTRSTMLETIRQDYIRTARAKGQTETKVIFSHALRNAFIPVITIIGMQFGNILGGSVISETVFAIPGIGQYSINAIMKRDMPAVMGCILFLSFCVCLINLIVDILYTFIDPRIKTQYQSKKKQAKQIKGGVVANE